MYGKVHRWRAGIPARGIRVSLEAEVCSLGVYWPEEVYMWHGICRKNTVANVPQTIQGLKNVERVPGNFHLTKQYQR